MTIDCSKLTPGQICVTRNGGESEYIGQITSEETDVYVFHSREFGSLIQIHKNGSWYRDSIHPNDIISIKKSKRVLDCWVNIYNGTTASFVLYHSKREASACSVNGPVACLHIVQEYEEGEGLL